MVDIQHTLIPVTVPFLKALESEKKSLNHTLPFCSYVSLASYMIIYSVHFINDFGYLLTTYSAPCTMLDAWDTVANKTVNFLFLEHTF